MAHRSRCPYCLCRCPYCSYLPWNLRAAEWFPQAPRCKSPITTSFGGCKTNVKLSVHQSQREQFPLISAMFSATLNALFRQPRFYVYLYTFFSHSLQYNASKFVSFVSDTSFLLLSFNNVVFSQHKRNAA